MSSHGFCAQLLTVQDAKILWNVPVIRVYMSDPKMAFLYLDIIILDKELRVLCPVSLLDTPSDRYNCSVVTVYSNDE